jgi:hypothetical protein
MACTPEFSDKISEIPGLPGHSFGHSHRHSFFTNPARLNQTIEFLPVVLHLLLSRQYVPLNHAIPAERVKRMRGNTEVSHRFRSPQQTPVLSICHSHVHAKKAPAEAAQPLNFAE